MTQSDDERLASAVRLAATAIIELVTAIRQLPSRTDGLAACLERGRDGGAGGGHRGERGR